VTGRAADPSYGDELRALEESITDSASAVAAMVRVPAVGSTRAVLHVVPSLQKVSLWPLVASRISMR